MFVIPGHQEFKVLICRLPFLDSNPAKVNHAGYDRDVMAVIVLVFDAQSTCQ